MATETGSQVSTTWPIPKFSFLVKMGTILREGTFKKVTGMDNEGHAIAYRKSTIPAFAAIKMQGTTKQGNITLKRSVVAKDNSFLRWQLNIAWPIKITATNLKSVGNEVAIETIELAYEEMIIANG